MKARYDVYQNDAVVGQLYIRPAGLYYQLDCRCNLSSKEIMELWMETANGCEKIGILVPYGEEFGIVKEIPKKRVSSVDVRFVLKYRTHNGVAKSIPVEPDKPFLRIADLPYGRLIQQDGKSVIEFPS